jgi:hypothetical protein
MDGLFILSGSFGIINHGQRASKWLFQPTLRASGSPKELPKPLAQRIHSQRLLEISLFHV